MSDYNTPGGYAKGGIVPAIPIHKTKLTGWRTFLWAVLALNVLSLVMNLLDFNWWFLVSLGAVGIMAYSLKLDAGTQAIRARTAERYKSWPGREW